MDDSMKHKVTCRTKGLQQYKWIKGENPGINKKKIPPGHGCLCCVERTVAWNVKSDMKDERI
jgi:hypothetical protein